MKNIFYYILSIILTIPSISFAQGVGYQNGTGVGFQNGESQGLENPLRVNDINQLFVALLEILVIFAIPIVAFFIIYAGFLYVTARGNTDQVTQAHRALLYAVVGGVLILGGEVLIQVIKGTVEAVGKV